jgi:hypothetical protein
MSNLTIEVWDATGNKKQLDELPADAPVIRVIAVLVDTSASRHNESGAVRMCEFSAENDTSSRFRRHREMLAIACAAGILAFALQELPGGRVSFRALTRIPLPQTCFSRSWLGLKCPGCGLTRSIIHLAEGDWEASWRNHRLGSLMAVVIVFQVPYRLIALRRPDWPMLPGRWLVVFGYLLVALLIGNWLVDVVAGHVISA